MNTRGLVVAALALALVACGPDDSSGDGGNAGTGGGAGSGATGGSNASGAGGSGAGGGGGGGGRGNAGSGTGGSSGSATGGSPTGDCSGAFGEPELLFSGDVNLGSVSVTADELEMYYVDDEPFVRKRASRSDPFGDAEILAQVASTCAADDVTLDVSEDGLRLYFVCSNPDLLGSLPEALELATRPDRSSDFEVTEAPGGSVNPSFGLTANELTVYAFATSSAGSPGTLRMWERSSTSDGFDSSDPVPGITGDLLHPDPTHDELGLYGYVRPDYHLALSTRASASESFSAPRTDGLPVPPEDWLDASPAISADCRTLYFTRMPASPRTVVEVYAAHR